MKRRLRRRRRRRSSKFLPSSSLRPRRERERGNRGRSVSVQQSRSGSSIRPGAPHRAAPRRSVPFAIVGPAAQTFLNRSYVHGPDGLTGADIFPDSREPRGRRLTVHRDIPIPGDSTATPSSPTLFSFSYFFFLCRAFLYFILFLFFYFRLC